MAEKSDDDFHKLDDLDQLLNSKSMNFSFLI